MSNMSGWDECDSAIYSPSGAPANADADGIAVSVASESCPSASAYPVPLIADPRHRRSYLFA